MSVQVQYFILAPRIKEALRNRGERELDDWEKQRIKYHYKIGIHKPSFGEIVDNSSQTPEETIKEILEMLNATNNLSN
jgi:cytidylate kinase